MTFSTKLLLLVAVLVPAEAYRSSGLMLSQSKMVRPVTGWIERERPMALVTDPLAQQAKENNFHGIEAVSARLMRSPAA
eukprot:3579810-Rhodomonas_salina.1